MKEAGLKVPERRDGYRIQRDRLLWSLFGPCSLVILIALVLGRVGHGRMVLLILFVLVPVVALLFGGLYFVLRRQQLRPPEFSSPMVIAVWTMWISGLIFALSISDSSDDKVFPSLLGLIFGELVAATLGLIGVIAAVLAWSVALVGGITTLHRQKDDAFALAQAEYERQNSPQANYDSDQQWQEDGYTDYVYEDYYDGDDDVPYRSGHDHPNDPEPDRRRR